MGTQPWPRYPAAKAKSHRHGHAAMAKAAKACMLPWPRQHMGTHTAKANIAPWVSSQGQGMQPRLSQPLWVCCWAKAALMRAQQKPRHVAVKAKVRCRGHATKARLRTRQAAKAKAALCARSRGRRGCGQGHQGVSLQR
nr:hypothetical protein CFP56_45732 [Quercus suber]